MLDLFGVKNKYDRTKDVPSQRAQSACEEEGEPTGRAVKTLSFRKWPRQALRHHVYTSGAEQVE